MKNLHCSYLPPYFNDSTSVLHGLYQRAQWKFTFKLPSAAFLLQRYAFLLKEARNYWKIFEAEEDKKEKVYPACPMYGASEDTSYLITLSRKPLTPLNFLHFTIFPLYNVKKTKEKALKSITYLYFYYFWTNVSTKSVCLHDSNAY